jgi:anti-sigma-K factor RskA
MSERCQHADTVAAYLLGALSDGERAQFEAHLVTCTACRDDVATLGYVVDALPAIAPPARPPVELRTRLMETVRAEADVLHAAGPEADRPRRSWSWLEGMRRRPLALAGAFSVLLLAVLGGFGLRAATDQTKTRTVVQVRTRTVSASVDQGAAPKGTAFVVLRDGAGTLRVKGLPAPPRGYVYEVWLLRRGAVAPSPTDALFSVNHRGSGRVALPSVHDVKAVLVTAEPDGGSPAPTSQPVINASL